MHAIAMNKNIYRQVMLYDFYRISAIVCGKNDFGNNW